MNRKATHHRASAETAEVETEAQAEAVEHQLTRAELKQQAEQQAAEVKARAFVGDVRLAPDSAVS